MSDILNEALQLYIDKEVNRKLHEGLVQCADIIERRLKYIGLTKGQFNELSRLLDDMRNQL